VLEGLDARVPLEEAIEWTPETGLSVVPHTERDPFARVRFQDVQPFVQDDSRVEIARARWGEIELGRMTASVRVDRNVFSIRGMRVEREGALVTGQLVVDYLPGEERIHFRGNVTGLRPRSTDEPLDANAAIVFDPRQLELDGRVQIVRIGGRHMLELLEMIDPYRENGPLNRLRGALEWAPPQRASLAMSRGLMSMDIRLGGVLGSLLQFGAIRGIALGLFMSRHVAPYLSPE
jgi:translocation and assembly module TamB